jgi:hypothetical protein
VTVTEGRVSRANTGAEMAAPVIAIAVAWAKGLIFGNLDMNCSSKEGKIVFDGVSEKSMTGV